MTMNEILQDAYAVLLPAISDLRLTDDLTAYFRGGGRTLLLGETREEYVTRQMAAERMDGEAQHHFKSLILEIAGMAGPPLIAVDQEPSGIQRLHRLVPEFPALKDLLAMSSSTIEKAAEDVAHGAMMLGVNMFLAPIADVVTGQNAWLNGRTLGRHPEQVARICGAFIRGAERAGVVTTPKHFPGHHTITSDPAIDLGFVTGDTAELQTGFRVFEDVFAAKPSACMIGPALVPAVDAVEPSSTSAMTVKLLRDAFQFKGMIVSDDLDGKATLAGRSIEQTAIASVLAGAELLLISAGPQIHSIANALASTASMNESLQKRLANSAQTVRRLAEQRRTC
jgi:beta-N-acetylhexosaminidase